MLLAVDVGNTNVTFALFDGERLAADWRVTSHRERTADEMAVELRELFSLRGLELSVVTGVVISSVVPILNAPLIEASRRYLKHEPGMVARMVRELGGSARVIATGGQASLVAGLTQVIEATDPLLTLEGLRLIYLQNSDGR